MYETKKAPIVHCKSDARTLNSHMSSIHDGKYTALDDHCDKSECENRFLSNVRDGCIVFSGQHEMRDRLDGKRRNNEGGDSKDMVLHTSLRN